MKSINESFDKKTNVINFDKIEDLQDNLNKKKDLKKKRKFCKKFPTAYVILLGFEVFAYILSFIIQKGKYQTIEYSNNNFIIKYQDESTTTIPATQDELNRLNIKIPLKNFKDGLITKPIPIPNTYEKIEGENISFFALFINPVKGVINSINISLFIMFIYLVQYGYCIYCRTISIIYIYH
jgi:uncharacterized ion transporter superfamily protein YfcC